MQSVLRLFTVLALALSQAASSQAQPRKSVPDAAAQKAAEKIIRDVFKEEYSKKGAPDRVSLAGKLLDQARQTRDDPASQYVLFRESQELYTLAGDITAALKAIDELAKQFAADVSELRSAALSAFAKSAKTPEELKSLATAQLRLVDEALANDQYEIAEKAASAASLAARKGGLIPMVTQAAAKSKEVAERKGKFEKLKRARETLAAKPEDPAANLALGQYHCFVKGNWEVGLPMLSLGSDRALKSLADRELAPPASPADQAAVGDGWWDLAEKEPGPSKETLRRHAVLWYEKATPKLAGLTRTKIEKRVSEFRAAILAKGTWQDVTEPKLFGKTGAAGDPIVVTAKKGFYTYHQMNPFPKGDFDGVSVRVRMDPAEGAMALVIFEGRDKGAFVDANREIFVATHHEEKTWKHDFSTKWEKKEESVITVLVVEGEYVIYLDNQEMARMKTLHAALTSLTLEAWDGTIKYDRIRLRKIE